MVTVVFGRTREQFWAMNPRELRLLWREDGYYNDPESRKKNAEPGTPLDLHMLSKMRRAD